LSKQSYSKYIWNLSVAATNAINEIKHIILYISLKNISLKKKMLNAFIVNKGI